MAITATQRAATVSHHAHTHTHTYPLRWPSLSSDPQQQLNVKSLSLTLSITSSWLRQLLALQTRKISTFLINGSQTVAYLKQPLILLPILWVSDVSIGLFWGEGAHFLKVISLFSLLFYIPPFCLQGDGVKAQIPSVGVQAKQKCSF